MNMNLRVIYGSRTAGGNPTNRGWETIGGLHRFTGRAARRFATRRAHLASERTMERSWFWRQVKLEVERARRTERDFTVLRVRHVDHSTLAELAALLRPHLRGTDAVLADTDRLLILLSETATDGAHRAVQRLVALSGDRIRAAEVDAVAFPRDAITFGGLVDGLVGPDAGRRLSIAG